MLDQVLNLKNLFMELGLILTDLRHGNQKKFVLLAGQLELRLNEGVSLRNPKFWGVLVQRN